MRTGERWIVGVLALLAGSSGVALLRITLLEIPARLPLRGAAAGLGVSILSLSAFALGVMFARRRSAPSSPPPAVKNGTRVTPNEAKYWLQRFLEEHQRKRRASVPPAFTEGPGRPPSPSGFGGIGEPGGDSEVGVPQSSGGAK